MRTILPVPQPSSTGWVLDDYAEDYEVSGAAVGGTCTVEFGPVPEDERWLVDRITVSCTSAAVTSLVVYLDQARPDRAVDQTPTGNFDVADEAQPILVQTTSVLLLVWSGASAGAVGTARIQYRVLRRAS